MRKTAGIVGILALLIILAIPPVYGRVSYQGVLRDSTGGTQAATKAMVFAIYNTSSKSGSGTDVLLWSESHPSVQIAADGTFGVELGSITPFPDSLFSGNSDLWVQVTVAGQTILPRTHLGGVPSSDISRRLNGDLITSPGQLRIPGVDSTDWFGMTTTGFTFPLQTDCYAIPPCGGWNTDNGAASTYTYDCSYGGGTIYAWSPTGLPFALVAETHLPLGATITGMQVFVKDSDASNNMQFHLDLVSHDVSNQPVHSQLGTVSSSGSTGTWQKLTVPILHNITNLADTTYIVQVEIPAGVTTYGLEWGLVKVCYAINKLAIRH